MASREIVIGYLYPGLMNLYGDRGNILCLTARCRWRGIGVQVHEIATGDHLDPRSYDVLFIGGGQDKEQKRVAEDLVKVKGAALKEAVEDGVVVLAVCGGFQLFGRYYQPALGPRLPGLGIFDAWTIHRGPHEPRCIGNLVAQWNDTTLVGFENHGGLTYLSVSGGEAKPLARVIKGHGNNSKDGTEGAVYKNAFGTYLHGSFLPKNPRFADHLLGLALERKYGSSALSPLEDGEESRSHQAALKLALKSWSPFPWKNSQVG